MTADGEDWDGSSPWLFLLGLAVFLGSGLLFLADLIRGVDVLRGIVANGIGMALLITWAAHDTLLNPDSEVGSPAGAAGTALLLYGLYLLGAGAVIVVTGLVHDHLQLGFWYLGLAAVATAIGFYIFPRNVVTGEEMNGSEAEADENDESEEPGDATEEPDE